MADNKEEEVSVIVSSAVANTGDDDDGSSNFILDSWCNSDAHYYHNMQAGVAFHLALRALCVHRNLQYHQCLKTLMEFK